MAGPAPIYIDFIARGMPDVSRAFRSIQDAVVRNERATTTTVRSGRSAKEREFQRLAREAERWGRDEARTRERSERDKQRATERTAAAMSRIRDRSAAMAGQWAAREVREHERAEQAKTRASEREAQKRERIAERTARNEQRKSDKRADSLSRTITGAGRNAVNTLVRGGTSLVNGALNVAGGFSIQDSMQREISLRGAAAQMAASSSLAGGAKISGSQILSRARVVGNEAGFDPSQVMEGIGKFKDLTGDLGRAMEFAPELAKLANATGGDIGELGQLAGNIVMSNDKISNADLRRQLAVFSRQGQVGGVEIADMAKYGARLTAGAGLFGGDRMENLSAMGAIAQVARQHGGAASPAEAAMAAQRFATDVQKHSGDLEAQGIKVSDGKGGMRNVKDIMGDMLERSGGDVTKLTKFGLGERGIRALTGFSEIYREAGGGKAGKAAVMAEWKKYTGGVSDQAMDAAAKERVAEVDKQVLIAMNQLRDAVGTQLVPEFIRLVPVLRDAMPAIQEVIKGFAKLAEWAAANPIKASLLGLGAMITKEVVAQIVAAKIGETIKSLIANGGVPGGGAGGTGGKVGAAVGAGILAGLVTKDWVDTEFGQHAKDASSRVTHQNEALNLLTDLNSGGPMTDEQRRAAIRMTQQLAADQQAQKNDLMNPSLVKTVTATVGNVVAPTETAIATQKDDAEQHRSMDATNEMMKKLVAALEANTSATQANSKSGGGAPGGANPQGEADTLAKRNPRGAR
ncbi:MAG: phage tail tape measure protein [Deltaproteobacteria bacterium]|nr:phage tail tape measure protein [Deltaproteobacteria bacterium]